MNNITDGIVRNRCAGYKVFINFDIFFTFVDIVTIALQKIFKSRDKSDSRLGTGAGWGLADYLPLPPPSHGFKFTHKILPYKWIAKLAFSIIPNVPMERKNGCLASFLPTMRTYGTLLSLFYVPSERFVGRKNNMMPFRSIGTTGESGVLLVVDFVDKLKPRRRNRTYRRSFLLLPNTYDVVISKDSKDYFGAKFVVVSFTILI